jgi:hypothetical protein
MKFRTESGSVYELGIVGGVECVRRLNPNYTKRADGEWVRVHNRSEVMVGAAVWLMVESLAHLGSDDTGNDTVEGANVTHRLTTPVEEVWA